MNRIIAIFITVAVFFSSCAVTNPNVNFTYPAVGETTNNIDIVAKDFETAGIVFVSSTETMDTEGNHTGSQITYEMFMKEAQKLGADDVLNIKIDINKIVEKITVKGLPVTVTTFNYTGSGIAIKYTDAAGASELKSDMSDSMNTALKAVTVTPIKTNWVSIIVWSGIAIAGIIGAAYLISSVSNNSNSPSY